MTSAFARTLDTYTAGKFFHSSHSLSAALVAAGIFIDLVIVYHSVVEVAARIELRVAPRVKQCGSTSVKQRVAHPHTCQGWLELGKTWHCGIFRTHQFFLRFALS